MKTYKIKKLEIPEQVQRYFQQIFNKTGATFLDKINELIDAHNESLSDKEEDKLCDCGSGLSPEVCRNNTSEPKQEEETENCLHCEQPSHKGRCWIKTPIQSTSLKEEIIETIWMAHGQSAVVPNTSDKILSLIQSHLVKEIENLTQETVLDDLKREFPVLYKQDIIKIINNI